METITAYKGELISRWGALYLAFPAKTIPLFCLDDLVMGEFKFSLGDKISRIGKRNRTSFDLKAGFFMTFAGTILDENKKDKIAVFYGNWDPIIEGKRYYFAFLIVPKTNMFYIPTSNFQGGREVVVDEVTHFKPIIVGYYP